MILVAELGNTHTVLGFVEGTEVLRTARFRTLPRTTDELGLLLSQLLTRHDVDPSRLEGALLGSVVPSAQHTLRRVLALDLGLEALVVGRGLKTGLRLRTDNPREVGADRIVGAVAARSALGGPCVVVRMGTATTFDCVDARGDYVGGAIAPGFEISEEALFARTAKLPRVEVTRPSSAVGTNTVHALQAGLFYGYVGLVDGLVERLREELGGTARVVATGRLAGVFGEASRAIDLVDRDLPLRGLAELYHLTVGGGARGST